MPHLMWCVASLFRSCRCHPLCDRALLVSLIIPACQDTRALKAKELKHHFVQNKKKKRLVGGLRLIACVCLTHSLQSSTYRTTCKENFKYIYVRVCVCVCIYKYIHIYHWKMNTDFKGHQQHPTPSFWWWKLQQWRNLNQILLYIFTHTTESL